MKTCSPLVYLWLFSLVPLSWSNDKTIPKKVGKFLDKYCIACHGPKKQKADFRVDKLKIISSPHEAEEWQLVLDNLHLQDMPPEDEPQPKIDERTQVTDWIEEELKRARKVLRGHTGEVVLRRLNRFEYQNTVEDIFGVHRDYTVSFPEDAKEEGFDNNGAALMLSATQIESYMKSAEQIINDSIVLSARPKTQKKSISLQQINKDRWEKNLSGHNNKKKNLAKLTPNAKKRFLEEDKLFKKDPYWKFVFPAVKNGKLVLPRPDDPPNTEYAMHRTSYFFLNPASRDIFRVKEAGWYKFSVKAYALNTEGYDIRMKIVYGDLGNKAALPKLAGYAFLKENKPEDHSFKVYLQKGDFFRIEGTSHGVKKIDNKDLSTFTGPFSVVRSLTLEGPLVQDWPPKGHKAILGNANPEKVDRKVAEETVKRLAPKLFRRSVDSKTTEKYLAIYDSFAKKEQALDALKTMLQAMLVSPQFLYHYEATGTIDNYALASRLSYFLWRSTPDQQLFDLAAKGQLKSKLKSEIKRMLADEKSKRFVKNFTGQWLHIDKVGEMKPDRSLYPEYNDLLEEAILAETHGFVEEVFYKNLSIDNFIDSDWTILNEKLAKIYKIPNVVGLNYRKVKLDKANTVRGGLLTQASILNVTSNGTTTSPIIRGVWILDHFLGTPAPPPPPDVPPIEPDIRGASTIKEQLTKHREIETCNSCHRKIDPFGVAMESFDVIGQFRNRYRALKPGKRKKAVLSSGKHVEAFDSIPSMGSYKSFVEFRNILKENKKLVYHNLAHKLATFALGRSLDFSDREYLDQIVHNTVKKDSGMQTMVYELITNPIFTKP